MEILFQSHYVGGVVFDNIVQDKAIPVYETKSIAVPVSRLMPTTLLYNTITKLYIVIIYSRTAVFISTFFSVKLELFLKKGGVIQSLLPTIGLDYFIQPWSRF